MRAFLAVLVVLAASLLAVPTSEAQDSTLALHGPETGLSPEPSFTDVTGGVHGANIEALSTIGLFEGTECGERRFCPDEPAKRWAVAVWIVRVLDGGNPSAEVTESRFSDVDYSEWWTPYVERLADLGVTVGCTTEPLRFCPAQTVSRGHIASFLVRSFDLADAPSAGFADTKGKRSRGGYRRTVRGWHDRWMQDGAASLLPWPTRVSRSYGHLPQARPRHAQRDRLDLHERGTARR